jgi:hypothetical protein
MPQRLRWDQWSIMKFANRLPREFISGSPLPGSEALIDAVSCRAIDENSKRDAAATLLHMLTRLANCGMDAGAPPLLKSAPAEI